jgi:hypothetical protein
MAQADQGAARPCAEQRLFIRLDLTASATGCNNAVGLGQVGEEVLFAVGRLGPVPLAHGAGLARRHSWCAS